MLDSSTTLVGVDLPSDCSSLIWGLTNPQAHSSMPKQTLSNWSKCAPWMEAAFLNTPKYITSFYALPETELDRNN